MKAGLPFIAALCLSLPAFAQYPGGTGGPGGPGPQGGPGGAGGGQRPPGPPPEAYAACKGKKEGDTAVMQTPYGQQQGTCRMMWTPPQQAGQAPQPAAPQPKR